MKKLLFLSVCLLTMPALAQKTGECALTPLQSLVVNARNANEVHDLITRGVVFEEPVRCGGTLTQLAIRRGNPDVLKEILQQDTNRAKAVVSLDAFPILGAPKQVPVLLFAAYYAPNREVVDLLRSAGTDIAVTDDFGRNVLWYLNKNPVLRNTDLQDELNRELLYGVGAPVNQATAQPGNAMAQPTNLGGLVPSEMPASAAAMPVSPTDKLISEN